MQRKHDMAKIDKQQIVRSEVFEIKLTRTQKFATAKQPGLLRVTATLNGREICLADREYARGDFVTAWDIENWFRDATYNVMAQIRDTLPKAPK